MVPLQSTIAVGLLLVVVQQQQDPLSIFLVDQLNLTLTSEVHVLESTQTSTLSLPPSLALSPKETIVMAKDLEALGVLRLIGLKRTAIVEDNRHFIRELVVEMMAVLLGAVILHTCTTVHPPSI
jgi:hypothetical protein